MELGLHPRQSWGSHGGEETSGSTNLTGVPLSDPRCNSAKCPAYAAARNASRAAISRDSQIEYGIYTTYFYCAIVAVFTVVYLERRMVYHHHEAARPKATLRQRAEAVLRWAIYRHIPVVNMSVGVLALLLLFLVFSLATAFAQRPYYRERIGFGSPPLAVRTGMMSGVLTPVILGLGGKWNLISLLTGCSYERLNVFHRYVSLLAFILALLHTFPFIIAPLRDGGTAELKQRFYREGSLMYSGVPPLAVLFFLCALSVRWLRRHFYEWFVVSHIAAAISYLGLLFWHVPKDEWPWLWATVALWALQITARIVLKTRLARAKLESINGEMLRLSIAEPPKSWTPCQHVFLRFPTLQPWENHPFTVASASGFVPGGNQKKDMTFLIHPYEGITKRLHDLSERSPSTTLPVVVDGPYGGHNEDFANRFESLVLVAGGCGIGGVLALFETLGPEAGSAGRGLQHVELIWIVVAREHIDWAGSTINRVKEHAAKGAVGVNIYVAGESESGSRTDVEAPATSERDGNTSGSEKGIFRADSAVAIIQEQTTRGVRRNPDGSPVLAELIPLVLKGKRNCVVVCGPDGLLNDAANAVALCQEKVLHGELQEVSLRTQVYGW